MDAPIHVCTHIYVCVHIYTHVYIGGWIANYANDLINSSMHGWKYTDPVWVPTTCYQLLFVLKNYFPKHHLLLIDFEDLPGGIQGTRVCSVYMHCNAYISYIEYMHRHAHIVCMHYNTCVLVLSANSYLEKCLCIFVSEETCVHSSVVTYSICMYAYVFCVYSYGKTRVYMAVRSPSGPPCTYT